MTGAPAWAEAPGRPASALPGTWKPSPSDLADFMRAVAARYSGGFDPDGPGPAPPIPGGAGAPGLERAQHLHQPDAAIRGPDSLQPRPLPGDAQRGLLGGEGGGPEDAGGHRRNCAVRRSPGRKPDAPGDVLARGAVREPGEEEEAEAQEEEACREAQSGRGGRLPGQVRRPRPPPDRHQRRAAATALNPNDASSADLEPNRARAARRRACRDRAAGTAPDLGDGDVVGQQPAELRRRSSRAPRALDRAGPLSALEGGRQRRSQPGDSRCDDRAAGRTGRGPVGDLLRRWPGQAGVPSLPVPVRHRAEPQAVCCGHGARLRRAEPSRSSVAEAAGERSRPSRSRLVRCSPPGWHPGGEDRSGLCWGPRPAWSGTRASAELPPLVVPARTRVVSVGPSPAYLVSRRAIPSRPRKGEEQR